MWEICLDILTAEGNLFQKVVDSHTKGFNKGAFMEAGQIKKVESLLYDEYTEDEIQAIVSQISFPYFCPYESS